MDPALAKFASPASPRTRWWVAGRLGVMSGTPLTRRWKTIFTPFAPQQNVARPIGPASARSRHESGRLHEPDRSATELAVEEMERLVNEWFADVLQIPPEQRDRTLSTRRPLALLLADMPGKWQDQFLRPGPWPDEFVSAMREGYLRACPDFQLSKMTPRPFDLGPLTTLTQLGRLPYIRMVLIWAVFILLFLLVFKLTHAR